MTACAACVVVVFIFGSPPITQADTTDPTFYGGDLESAVFVQWTEVMLIALESDGGVYVQQRGWA